ncbi:MAG: glycosyltransferase family 4 protein [Candidatus Edwardsbacteria bacterium]
MRIAYISNGNPDVPAFDQLFLGKMVEQGHEPYYISYWPGEADYSKLGVRWIHYDPQPPRLLRIVLHLRNLLRQIQPDVLHTGWVQTAGFYGALSGFHPTLLMPWGHDILPHLDQPQYSESRWHKLITRFTIKWADMITCDCELVKNRIIEMTAYPANRIVVFPWGVDRATFKPSSSPSQIRQRLGWEDKKVLIMNRLFTPRRGIRYFIEALPAVVAEIPETRVLLVGYGLLEQELKRRVEELGLLSQVHFAGRVSNRDIAEYLHAADIYVTTSLSDGTSVSLLEAMACGLPVVVADAPAYFEWVRDGFNGFIVPRKDSTILAKRLVELLANEDLRRSMSERNLQIAQERADWDKNFETLEGLYEELVLS